MSRLMRFIVYLAIFVSIILIILHMLGFGPEFDFTNVRGGFRRR